MKILIAMDSFKGSMTSLQAGNAVGNGILKACSSQAPDIKVIPVADGGEGTVEALTYGRQVEKHAVTVTGPLGDPVQAEYIMVASEVERKQDNVSQTVRLSQQANESQQEAAVNAKTAIIEMAQAAGLPLVPEDRRNPLYTTTYGVGELINHAIAEGCRRFIVGIGGSATNDCGIGMLQALGYDFAGVDILGEISDNNALINVKNGAIALQDIAQIIDHNINTLLNDCEFIIACDVDNPLVGDKGCSRIFAPQKGATPEMMENMDRWMNDFADVVENYVNQKTRENHLQNQVLTKNTNRYTPGAGAAGGMGYAFLMFLGGKLMSGAQIVMEQNHIKQEIIASDFVITGEGKLDSQSSMGKLPTQIARLAKEHGKRTIAIAGQVAEDFTDSDELYYKVIQIERGDMNIEDAMKTENAIWNLEQTVIKQLNDILCKPI